MSGHVVIVGGGVGGLSAAHELAERGFRVTVLEDRTIPGGKARSLPGPTLGDGPDRPPLPGEHGFRFFPGFYKHIPDVMRRIPFGGQDDGVLGNLVDCPRFEFAREGQAPIVLPVHPPSSLDDVKLLVHAAVGADWGIPPHELAYFAERLLVLLTSCEERRFGEWEDIGWLDFVGAESRSEAYSKYLADGLTRSFVAAKANLMSTRTGGYVMCQLFFDMGRKEGDADRVLDGPTNERWIGPWVQHLTGLGVEVRTDARVSSIDTEGSRITGVTVTGASGPEQVTGDWYVAAVPVERMRALADVRLRTAEPALAALDQLQVRWMNGIQFYLTEDVPVVHGHTVYIDAPWALTSISQAQFWTGVDLGQMADGQVKGVLSVDVSDWETKGYNGKKASECSHDEIVAEAWTQLCRHLDADGAKVLEGGYHAAFIDPDIAWPGPHQEVNAEPLLINTVGSWKHRPEAVTAVENLFLASDYVRTHTDLACMEAANEAARRAVNGILEASGSDADPCPIWSLHEPAVFAPFRAADRLRWDLGHHNEHDVEASA